MYSKQNKSLGNAPLKAEIGVGEVLGPPLKLLEEVVLPVHNLLLVHVNGGRAPEHQPVINRNLAQQMHREVVRKFLILILTLLNLGHSTLDVVVFWLSMLRWLLLPLFGVSLVPFLRVLSQTMILIISIVLVGLIPFSDSQLLGKLFNDFEFLSMFAVLSIDFTLRFLTFYEISEHSDFIPQMLGEVELVPLSNSELVIVVVEAFFGHPYMPGRLVECSLLTQHRFLGMVLPPSLDQFDHIPDGPLAAAFLFVILDIGRMRGVVAAKVRVLGRLGVTPGSGSVLHNEEVLLEDLGHVLIQNLTHLQLFIYPKTKLRQILIQARTINLDYPLFHIANPTDYSVPIEPALCPQLRRWNYNGLGFESVGIMEGQGEEKGFVGWQGRGQG